MKRLAFIASFLFFYFCFSFNSALALAISPGRITMDFVPNYEDEFKGYISTQGEVNNIDVYVEGDLKDYITLLTPSQIMVYADIPVEYRFRIKLPEEFDKPGRHAGYIWAAEHVDPREGGAIARVKVGTTIWVNVPYPGKYAEIGFEIKNPNVNDTVIFQIPVSNLGKENITEAKGEIEILNPENRTIVILQTQGKFIESTKGETLEATWFSSVDPGLYNAKVKVLYDGETASLERLFNLGAPLIKIVNVSAEPVINGTIGKILTKIQSYWNEKISDVKIEIAIKNAADQTIGTTKSENFEVDAFSSPVITNYWDTTDGVPLGDFKGLIVLKYLDKNDTAEFDIKVTEKPFVFGTELLLLIVVAVGIVAVIVIIFVVRRKGKTKFKQKKLV